MKLSLDFCLGLILKSEDAMMAVNWDLVEAERMAHDLHRKHKRAQRRHLNWANAGDDWAKRWNWRVNRMHKTDTGWNQERPHKERLMGLRRNGKGK